MLVTVVRWLYHALMDASRGKNVRYKLKGPVSQKPFQHRPAGTEGLFPRVLQIMYTDVSYRGRVVVTPLQAEGYLIYLHVVCFFSTPNVCFIFIFIPSPPPACHSFAGARIFDVAFERG